MRTIRRRRRRRSIGESTYSGQNKSPVFNGEMEEVLNDLFAISNRSSIRSIGISIIIVERTGHWGWRAAIVIAITSSILPFPLCIWLIGSTVTIMIVGMIIIIIVVVVVEVGIKTF